MTGSAGTSVVRPVTDGLLNAAACCALLATAHSVWNMSRLRRPRTTGAAVPDRVSALVPARDEAGAIGHCLHTLRAQEGVGGLEILVLDDRSSDGTAHVVAHHVAADPRVRLLVGDCEPPAGWLGKAWACHRLARAASGDVLVFVDADVRLEPRAIAAAVHLLRDAELDLVSPYPRQGADSTAERLVQPLLQWSWLTFLPLRLAESSRHRSLTASNGQFLVVDATAYHRAGGHAAVRNRVVEDVALCAAVKSSGGRGGVVDGTHLAHCRMYAGWPALRDGYAKSLWSAFGSPGKAVAVAGLLTAVYVGPVVAATFGRRLGWLAYAAAVLGRVLVGRRTGARVWPDAFAHPASIVALDGLVARSVIEHRRGTLRWKGRLLTAPTSS